MIGVSKLYCASVEASDPLRYNRKSSRLPSHLLQFSKDKKPVIAWNMTRRCNLKCLHCYAGSSPDIHPGGMTETEEFALIDDLAAFGVPVLLFSGGEPLMHPRIFDLIEYTVAKGMRAVLSTNGTMISAEYADILKKLGLSYVGISIDGIRNTHNKFRCSPSAYDLALDGVERCMNAGIKVGLRFTITKYNYKEVDSVFDLLTERNIPRICLYHLAYCGRGGDIPDAVLDNETTRKVVDTIIYRTELLYNSGTNTEVLTVNNHCDGPYLYLKALKEKPEIAEDVLKLLKMNGGNNAGMGIACIDWDGNVHPDQFWRNKILGNVREKKFSDIWTDPENHLLCALRNRKKILEGRCAACRWLDICNGNSRARAEAAYGDYTMPDPACYLTDEEIAFQ